MFNSTHLSGRHCELTGKALDWKSGCAKSLPCSWIRNNEQMLLWLPCFPCPPGLKNVAAQNPAFCCRESWVGISSPDNNSKWWVIYSILTAGLTLWKTNIISLSTAWYHKRERRKQDELWKQKRWFYLFYVHSCENPPEKQILSEGKWWSWGVKLMKQCRKHVKSAICKSPCTRMRQETTAETLQSPKDRNGLSTDLT